MKSDQQKRNDLSAFLYTCKRAVSDVKKRDISDATFAGMIGITPGSYSKYINAAVTPGEPAVDVIATNLDGIFTDLNVDINAMDIYKILELPPRVSTSDKRLIEIVHLWNRLSVEQREALHKEFMERIQEVV